MTPDELAYEPRTLLLALIDKPRSREECAALLGDPRVSAAALSLLRDLRFIRFDPDAHEWYATGAGRTAVRP